MAACAF